jgi:hypothetical protein
MWRWYERAPSDFARIYNHAFGQDLSMTKIRDQFENYLRLHGGLAFPVYKAIYAVPFDDPADVYGNVRQNIEATAQSLDIDLRRRQEEATSPSGGARRAKSQKTRRLYKSLVRRASQEERSKAVQMQPVEPVMPRRPSLGRTTLVTDTESDMIERFSDTEDSSAPDVKLPERKDPSEDVMPKLGFRVWDEDSKTKFTERGFESAAHLLWRGDPIPPFNADTQLGKAALNLFTNIHLSMSGGKGILAIAIEVDTNSFRPVCVCFREHESNPGLYQGFKHEVAPHRHNVSIAGLGCSDCADSLL